jgi:hypothetical protein
MPLSSAKVKSMKVGLIALALAASAWSTAALSETASCPLASSARNIVFVARYGAQDDASKHQLSNFLAFLGDRIEVWRGSLNSLHAKAPFLEQLSIVADRDLMKMEMFSSANAYEAWSATPNRLQILYGTITNPAGRYTITSRVHLGNLEGGPNPSSVVVTLPMNEATIGATNDAHSFITYYSLALEARRLKCPSFVVQRLLEHASEVGSDLKRRIPNDPEINRVITSIQNLSSELMRNP